MTGSRMVEIDMAHTKALSTTANGRDSQPSYLGVKLSAGQAAKIGNIIIRQHGTKYLPGTGVRLGSDYTIYAVTDGKVSFTTKRKTGFNGDRRIVKVVNVVAN
jgi:large subunit ribosomal protein L27